MPQGGFTTKLAEFCQWYEQEKGPAKDFNLVKETAGTRQRRRSFMVATFYSTIRWSQKEKLKLLYMVNIINSTMTTSDSPSAIRSVYEYWQQVVADENELPDNIGMTPPSSMHLC